MVFLNHEEYKRLAEEQGRKPGWIANQLQCSYSTVYKFFNGIKHMSNEKIEKLHSILINK